MWSVHLHWFFSYCHFTNSSLLALVWGTMRMTDANLNPLNAELNPICHLLTSLGAHHILHVSGLMWRSQRCDEIFQASVLLSCNIFSSVTSLWCFFITVKMLTIYWHRYSCKNSGKWPTWHTDFFHNMFIWIFYMFRATMCSSSGGQLY
jgi:hypothetical protein